jgi:hypothetical protein
MAKGMIVDPKFIWNTDANVGPGCPNKPEDVQLVQLGYACSANNPKNPASAEEKAAFGAVVPGASYTGAPNDPLTIAIKLHQKNRGGTQDGVVSSIKSNTGTYAAGMTWIMIALNNNIADALGGSWPYLDKHPQCPKTLRDASLRVLTPRA